MISFQNFGRLHFCVDFRPSSELIGYVDLMDYEIWPKTLVINGAK